MSVHHETLEIRTGGRGLIDVTTAIERVVEASELQTGIVTVFCAHTSCSLVLMENADPSAQHDLEQFFERLAPDGDPRYAHSSEGPDDMSAHLRMALTRTSETVPLAYGRLTLGTWQGIFLWEHRAAPHRRSIVVMVIGE